VKPLIALLLSYAITFAAGVQNINLNLHINNNCSLKVAGTATIGKVPSSTARDSLLSQNADKLVIKVKYPDSVTFANTSDSLTTLSDSLDGVRSLIQTAVDSAKSATYGSIHSHDVNHTMAIPSGAGYTKVNSFAQNGRFIGTILDTVNDWIIINRNGMYFAEGYASFSPGNANIEFKPVLFLNSTELDETHDDQKYTTASSKAGVRSAGPVWVSNAPDTLTLRIRHSSGSSQNIDITYSHLFIQSVSNADSTIFSDSAYKAALAVFSDSARAAYKSDTVTCNLDWTKIVNEPSFVLQTTSVTAGTGLTGGGTLSQDRVISAGADLAAIANLTTNGLLVKSGSGAAKVCTLKTSNNGITVSNGTGVSGNPTSALTYGNGSNTVCQGNDARLSDARTPVLHQHDSIYFKEAELTGGTIDLYLDSLACTKVRINGAASSAITDSILILKNGVVSYISKANFLTGIGAAPLSHTQAISTITGLTESLDSINDTLTNLKTLRTSKQNAITAGATTQYLRGNFTWNTLDFGSVLGAQDTVNKKLNKTALDDSLRNADSANIRAIRSSSLTASQLVGTNTDKKLVSLTRADSSRAAVIADSIVKALTISKITGLQIAIDAKLDRANLDDSIPHYNKGAANWHQKSKGSGVDTNALMYDSGDSTVATNKLKARDKFYAESDIYVKYDATLGKTYFDPTPTAHRTLQFGGVSYLYGYAGEDLSGTPLILSANAYQDGTTWKRKITGGHSSVDYGSDGVSTCVDGSGTAGAAFTRTLRHKIGTWGTKTIGTDSVTSNSYVAGGIMSGGYINSNADLDVITHSTGGTYSQLASVGWGNSHALLFNAYKKYSGIGDMSTLGNTKYTYNNNTYSSGAGMIEFLGNGGNMRFFVSPVSTGINSNVDWGNPVLTLSRDGNIYTKKDVYIPTDLTVGKVFFESLDPNFRTIQLGGGGIFYGTVVGHAFPTLMLLNNYSRNSAGTFIRTDADPTVGLVMSVGSGYLSANATGVAGGSFTPTSVFKWDPAGTYTIGSDSITDNLKVGGTIFNRGGGIVTGAIEVDTYVQAYNGDFTRTDTDSLNTQEFSSPCTLWNNGQKDIQTAYKQMIGNFVEIAIPSVRGGINNAYAKELRFDAGFINIPANTHIKPISTVDTAAERFANAAITPGSDNSITLNWTPVGGGYCYIYAFVFKYRKAP
jgi:hypothetical protein